MNRKYLTILLLSSLFFVACNEDQKTQSTEEELEEEMVVEKSIEEPKIDEQKQIEIDGIISSMPSPLEIVSTIKQSGATFNIDILNSLENKDKYTQEYKKALNIGVYGTDMSYINIYGKTMHVLNYASVVQSLSEELNVGHFFDLKLLSRLIESDNNMDSLILLSTRNYNDMDRFLREQGRGEVSALMAVGAWTEGVSILLDMYEQSNDDVLKEKIGEQKIVIGLLTEVMSYYKDEKELAGLIAQLESINALYDTVKEEITEGEIITKEVDGMLVIEDTGKSVFKVSDETLASILTQVDLLKTEITNIN